MAWVRDPSWVVETKDLLQSHQRVLLDGSGALEWCCCSELLVFMDLSLTSHLASGIAGLYNSSLPPLLTSSLSPHFLSVCFCNNYTPWFPMKGFCQHLERLDLSSYTATTFCSACVCHATLLFNTTPVCQPNKLSFSFTCKQKLSPV